VHVVVTVGEYQRGVGRWDHTLEGASHSGAAVLELRIVQVEGLITNPPKFDNKPPVTLYKRHPK
jgi:hypothetical protein